MKYYVGLDVSLATTAICAVAENGAIIREGVAASDPDEIANWLDRLGLAFERVRLETGSTAAWLYSGRAGCARGLHRSSPAPRGYQDHADQK
jgi:transposase